MKGKTIIIIISISLLSCKKIISEKTDFNILEPKIEKKIDPQNIKPLFIGLSPNMSDVNFEEEIRKLNDKGKLLDGKFLITVKNENYPFEIFKTNNSIVLKYSIEESKSLENVSYAISDSYLAYYKNKVKAIIEVFDLKYKVNKIQIPANVYLGIYGLEMHNYKLYHDDKKSILVGFKQIGNRYPSAEEIEIEKQISEEKTSDNFLDHMASLAKNERPLYVQFGLKIEISYYETLEIERILDELVKVSSKKKDREIRELKKEEKQKNAALNNINDL